MVRRIYLCRYVYLVKHEFIKRLDKRYAQEGINIPYPIRAINYDQEKTFE